MRQLSLLSDLSIFLPSFHSHPLLKRSLLIAMIFLAAAFVTQRWTERPLRIVESALSCFSALPGLPLFLVFFAVIAIRVSVLSLLPVPVPGIHDEYSYLLMGDTFAHGRLANPSHPMWRSFDSFHINWLPTYSSIYPPAQGLVVAIGQLLGNPWIGVLLSAAAMCSVITWMLRAWVPARWAFLGGTLTALKFGVASYWINSYWGGAAAAIGGALLLGALPQISRRPNYKNAIILALGIAILANSRPYEGLLFCIPPAIWFVWWLAGKTCRAAAAKNRTRVLVAVLLVLIPTAAFMGYYNWRLTGDAFLLPHALRTKNYHSSALFLWQHPRPPMHYNNQQFEEFYNGWERENYQRTWDGAKRVSKEKLGRLGNTFFWWGAVLLLPGLPFALRDKKMRLSVATLLIGTLGVFAVVWSFPHYAAPFTCVIVALLVQSLRHVRVTHIAGWPLGKWFARAAVLLLFVDTTALVAHRQCDSLHWSCQGDPSRAVIQTKLCQTPGKHLILVRYELDNHNIHDEWVYNGAEIDNAKVLWARELDEKQNAALLAYFKDRQIWLVEPDSDNTELIPYSPPTP
ncbi:MAG: hypothetical protein M3P45_10300 [Acidobacteriota bacterium]|nr:hypothetical protein [Acidobacteriota bacterium]